jgi:hypothetical protein
MKGTIGAITIAKEPAIKEIKLGKKESKTAPLIPNKTTPINNEALTIVPVII